MTTVERRRPLPYYRWFPRDHRAHRLCATLNCFEEGMLRRLLDEQWEEGAIPDDPHQLALLVREPIGVVTETWEKLRILFDSMPGFDGLYMRNERLEDERTKADSLRAMNSLKGKKGGRPKAEKSRGFQGHLDLEGSDAKALGFPRLDNPTKADESREKPPSQESSSRAVAEQSKSRRESPDGPCICGGTGGLHTLSCPIAAMHRFGATAESPPVIA